MTWQVWQGLLIPLLGTTLGAACVFFMKGALHRSLQRALTGFAAGVMVAASIWSLLIPAMDQASGWGHLAFVPAAVGFWLGILFLLALDKLIPHLHQGNCGAEGLPCGLGRSAMLTFAVALHNLPEGMAVGVVYAGLMTGAGEITAAGALALSLGIAIQNFPEGKSFFYGFLSGVVEPLGAVLTILLASVMVPVLPYALSFAAGAMIYVVVEELIPEMSEGEHSNIGVLCFSLGFTLMMILDVALG